MAEQITTPEALDALPYIRIKHEGGNTVGGRIDLVLASHLAKGWVLDLYHPDSLHAFRPDVPAPSAEDREALARVVGLTAEQIDQVTGVLHAAAHLVVVSGIAALDAIRLAAEAVAAFDLTAPVDAETTTVWAFESPQPGLYYVTANDMLIETMHRARPSARLLTAEATPWREVPRG